MITSFSVIPDVTCSGTTSSVPMAWSTRNAQTVVFEVDGAPVTAGAGYPVSGTGNVAVPCDGKEHEVALVAAGAGGRASVSRQVNTATSPPPVGAPLVTRFHMLEDVTCPGGTAEVAAAWVTQNASGRQLLGRRPAAAGRRRLPDHRHRQHRRSLRRQRPQGDADGDRHRAGGGVVAVGEHDGVDLPAHADGPDVGGAHHPLSRLSRRKSTSSVASSSGASSGIQCPAPVIRW